MRRRRRPPSSPLPGWCHTQEASIPLAARASSPSPVRTSSGLLDRKTRVLTAILAPQTPTFGYVGGPGSPHSSQQPFAGYKPHDSLTSPMYSSSAGSSPPRASQFSAYNGSDVAYRPVSELDGSSAVVVTPELPGSDAGRDWSSPMSAAGQRHDRHPASPQGWGSRNEGGLNVWNGSDGQRGYRTSR